LFFIDCTGIFADPWKKIKENEGKKGPPKAARSGVCPVKEEIGNRQERIGFLKTNKDKQR
jgi:hypothetical protein